MLRDFREKVNLKIYDSKDVALKTLRIIHFIIVFGMVGVLVYFYGFPQTEESGKALNRIIEYSFGFYIFRFLFKFAYDFNPRNYFLNNKFETGLILFLLVEGISYNLTGNLLIGGFFKFIGVEKFNDISTLVIQSFFVLYIITDLLKKRDLRQWLKVHPGLLFTLSIFVIMSVGAGLLMLPEMSVQEGSISFTDALFMSLSSTSVTGLSTIDISQALTFKGQLVILFLIQVGGLNTIAFAALYLFIAKFGIGIKQHELLEDYLNKESFTDTNSVFLKIVKWVLVIEIIGFILIFILLPTSGGFENLGDRIFHSIFHSISGFNNAGLSIIEGGLMHPLLAHNYILHFVFLLLFFLGGFGMIYLFDMLEIKRMRDRMRFPWKTLQFGTKITLYFTIALLVAGAIIFFIFERNSTMEGLSGTEKLITSLFQSMTTRNAGFNLVDTNALSLPVLIFFLFLMFIGAGSGSSGGGIRVSTFAVMIASVTSTITGKANIELFQRTLSNELVMKAYSIFIFFIVGNLIGIFALSISEFEAIASGKFSLMDIIFEHVSASCTVGLSTGITAELSDIGKYILMVAMFIGRVGTLTLAYLFGMQVISNKYKYPKGHTMVG